MSERVNTEWARFGAEIRRLRLQAGISQAKLGKQMGYSQAFIGKLERGTRTPNEDHVQALEECFGTRGTLLLRHSNIKRHEGEPDWYKKVVTSEERATEIRMGDRSTVIVPNSADPAVDRTCV